VGAWGKHGVWGDCELLGVGGGDAVGGHDDQAMLLIRVREVGLHALTLTLKLTRAPCP
jgi:hypothetical protein